MAVLSKVCQCHSTPVLLQLRCEHCPSDHKPLTGCSVVETPARKKAWATAPWCPCQPARLSVVETAGKEPVALWWKYRQVLIQSGR